MVTETTAALRGRKPVPETERVVPGAVGVDGRVTTGCATTGASTARWPVMVCPALSESVMTATPEGVAGGSRKEPATSPPRLVSAVPTGVPPNEIVTGEEGARCAPPTVMVVPGGAPLGTTDALWFGTVTQGAGPGCAGCGAGQCTTLAADTATNPYR